ncbi:MAG: hypothetical protein IJM94_04515, partial [Clostridia bacterium]|nr:hypothetical protein [Clostridia bacterium]
MAIDLKNSLRAAYLPSLDGKLPSQKQKEMQEDIYKFDGNFTKEQKEKAKQEKQTRDLIKAIYLTETDPHFGDGPLQLPKLSDVIRYNYEKQKAQQEKERAREEKEKFEKDALQREKTRITRNADFEKYSKFDAEKFQGSFRIPVLVNDPSYIHKVYLLDQKYQDIIKNMDDIERQTYNYYTNKYGEDRGFEYLENLEPTIKKRMANGEHYQEYYSNLNQEIKDMERVRQATDFDEYSKWSGDKTKYAKMQQLIVPDDAYFVINNYDYNNINDTPVKYSLNQDTDEGLVIRSALFMLPYEKLVFNYHYKKFGEDSALGYLKLIERKINQRKSEYESKQDAKFAEEHPVLAGGIGYPIASLGNLAGFLETAGQNFKNDVTGEDVPVDINKNSFSTVRFRNNVQQSLTEGKSGLAQLLINTGLSIEDMIVALPFGPVFGRVIMDSNAAAHKAYEVIERGGSTEQAFTLGFAAGITEHLTEKLPFENIFKLAKGPKLKFIEKVVNILKQSGMEGGEEFISEIANNVYDDLIMGEKSNFNITKNKYVEMGYSEDEASQKAFTDCYVVNPLMAYAGGAISGGAMGSGAVTVSDVLQNRMTDTEKEVSKIVKNAVVPSTEPASKQVTPAQTNGEVISTEMSDVGKTAETKHSIMRNSKGLYVQADEQVIKSDDDDIRAYEIMNYVKNKVMKGKTVEIVLDDGEKISITGRTAWKLADKGKLNDKLYLVKGNASGVIDEVVQTSKFDDYTESKKEHSDGFASEGFDYRTAYFRDLDGKYYRLTLSVGINADGKEAYNIGIIKEIPFPDKTVVGS